MPSPASWPRVIVHADMDAFYAAVEQLDNPELRGKPILVGPRSRRGVVLTASYEARPYGVGSAMPVSQALRRCPDAIMVPPRFERYQAVSRIIMQVFAQFSPEVEPLSLDEAFLNMSGTSHMFGPPEAIGRRIKDAVFAATGGLTVTVGISGTKYVAKVASAYFKPDGLTVVPHAEAQSWLAPQPVARLWGAGPKTQERLHALGLTTIGEVAASDVAWLRAQLGAAGAHFHALAHAEDPRRISTGRRARSIGSDRTLAEDVSSAADILPHLQRAADSLGRRLRRKGLLARGVRVKLKTSHFQLLTRQRQLAKPTDVAATLLHAARELLGEFAHPGPFRLVGLAVYDLASPGAPEQLGLFDAAPRRRQLETALDRISEKFGDHTVYRARDIGHGPRHDLNMDFLDSADAPDTADNQPHPPGDWEDDVYDMDDAFDMYTDEGADDEQDFEPGSGTHPGTRGHPDR